MRHADVEDTRTLTTPIFFIPHLTRFKRYREIEETPCPVLLPSLAQERLHVPHLPLAADTGRVHHPVRSAAPLEHGIDGISRGAGNVADD